MKPSRTVEYEEDMYNDNAMLPNQQYPLGSGFTVDPPRSNTEIDVKLITSGYKEAQMIFRQPIIKKRKVAEFFVDKKTGKPKLYNGSPVLKGFREVPVFQGYQNREIEFPIPNFHSDSVTSTFLDEKDVRAVNIIDETIWDLFTDLIENDADHMNLMLELHGKKASIVDTKKSFGGRGAEIYKTSISKGESKMMQYMHDSRMEEIGERKKKGLLGLGWGPL